MSDKKIFNTLNVIAVVLIMAMIVNLTYNFRNFSLQSHNQKHF